MPIMLSLHSCINSPKHYHPVISRVSGNSIVNVIKKVLIGIAKLILAIVILLSLTMGFVMWKKYPVETYCNDLEIGTTFETAVKLARDAELKAPFIQNEEKDRLLIFNQNSPFFRFACEATFKDGKLTSAKSFGAD